MDRCRCCCSDAERMLALAAELRFGKPGILVPFGFDDGDLARCRTALALAARGPAFRFRAVFEGWSLERINRELY